MDFIKPVTYRKTSSAYLYAPEQVQWLIDFYKSHVQELGNGDKNTIERYLQEIEILENESFYSKPLVSFQRDDFKRGTKVDILMRLEEGIYYPLDSKGYVKAAYHSENELIKSIKENYPTLPEVTELEKIEYRYSLMDDYSTLTIICKLKRNDMKGRCEIIVDLCEKTKNIFVWGINMSGASDLKDFLNFDSVKTAICKQIFKEEHRLLLILNDIDVSEIGGIVTVPYIKSDISGKELVPAKKVEE